VKYTMKINQSFTISAWEFETGELSNERDVRDAIWEIFYERFGVSIDDDWVQCVEVKA
tara:strand:+ start:229 stop:402 length:174 start_codon:yes stop_codon:yes gene_type:complete